MTNGQTLSWDTNIKKLQSLSSIVNNWCSEVNNMGQGMDVKLNHVTQCDRVGNRSLGKHRDGTLMEVITSSELEWIKEGFTEVIFWLKLERRIGFSRHRGGKIVSSRKSSLCKVAKPMGSGRAERSWKAGCLGRGRRQLWRARQWPGRGLYISAEAFGNSPFSFSKPDLFLLCQTLCQTSSI